MEEEAPSRHSVAELAGRFKGSAPPHDAAGNETDKPVRRRPPCSLQLPKTHGDDQEQSSGVTSPLPAKTKRNSALIEKLQASLSLSPSGPIPSPKSPGFRLRPPAFPPASPSSAPVTAVTTSSTVTPTSPVTASPVTEEEGPASFEDPPTVAEGSILLSMNKSRARHSLRRRPPSRRHRKSSSGDEVGVTNDVADKTTAGGGGGEKEEAGEVFKKEGTTDEMKDDKTDASTCPGEDQHETESREEDEKRKEGENGPMGGEEGDRSSSGGKEEEEEHSGENQAEDVSEGATNTESREEEKSAVIPT
ncbi:capZ-interacting protein-like isoform X1 [Seriola dumerili]|uniref:capZ-interacting protein-like isoform X1 n=1 Tax=Seriola dumerili TaxID=41447 RepID=UPI000BBECA79|nr:capZ-interacting protein-like isoform X1 [Seriola dumerili]